MAKENERPQRPKQQRTVYLSLPICAQIDDLIGYFGDSQGEVLTHILNDWLSGNQDKVGAQKTRIDALSPQIRALEEQEAAKPSKRKRRDGL